MKWSNTAWHEALPIYNTITAMPFIKELTAGTLNLEKFKYYMQQDAHYLEYFARRFCCYCSKSTRCKYHVGFCAFCRRCHCGRTRPADGYFKQYEVGERAPISPDCCHHYVHFMQSMTFGSDVSVAMAAVLPCFWIYKKVGDHILEHQSQNDNPYADWIATYAGEEFGLIVDKAIALCDAAAATATPAQQEAMTAAFVTASRLEFAFWDSAYKLEKW